jgi:hypothetical protein
VGEQQGFHLPMYGIDNEGNKEVSIRRLGLELALWRS